MSAVATHTATQLAKVLLVDDHHILLEALSFVMAPYYEVSCISSLRQLDFAFDTFRPDVLMIDISMPEGDGVSIGQRFARKYPELKLIFLSMLTDPRQIQRATDAGAHGFVSKRSSADDLLNAVAIVLSGGEYRSSVPGENSGTETMQNKELTERQIQVLRLVARGFSAKEIATDLSISVRTAEFHRGAIMQRLNMHSTALLTRYAIHTGLI